MINIDELKELEDRGHAARIEEMASCLEYLPSIVRCKSYPSAAKKALREILMELTAAIASDDFEENLLETVEGLHKRLVKDQADKERYIQNKRADQEIKHYTNSLVASNGKGFKKTAVLRKERQMISRMKEGGMTLDAIAATYNRRFTREIRKNALSDFSKMDISRAIREPV